MRSSGWRRSVNVASIGGKRAIETISPVGAKPEFVQATCNLQLRLPRDTRDANAIIAGCANRPSYVSPVRVFVIKS